MSTSSSSPTPTIGVFDSGFGGLTVLRALIARAPQARFAFIGDTARLPYGSKSRRTIARYAAQSARFLVEEQGAEYLVIACNTASALALDAIKDAVPSSVSVIGVIEPGAEAARQSLEDQATCWSSPPTPPCRATPTPQLAAPRACALLRKPAPCWSRWLKKAGPPASLLASVTDLRRRKPHLPFAGSCHGRSDPHLPRRAIAEAARGDSSRTRWCSAAPTIRCSGRLSSSVIPAGMKVIDSAESTADQLVTHLCQRSRRSAFDPAPADPDPPLLRHRLRGKVRAPRLALSRPPVGKVELVDLGG